MVPNFDYDGRFLPLSTMGRFFNVKHYCVHDGLRAFFWGGESERIGDCRGEFCSAGRCGSLAGIYIGVSTNATRLFDTRVLSPNYHMT